MTISQLETFIPIACVDELNTYNSKNGILKNKIPIHLHHHKKHESFIDFLKNIFETKHIVKHFILSIYLWIVNQILYYSVITNLDRIDNYISHSFEVYFTTQIISNISLGYFFHHIKPKNIIYFSSISNLLNLLIGVAYSDDSFVLMIVFFIFTFLSGMLNQSIYVFVPELFHAKIRSTCVSYSKFPGKIFLIITPFIWGTNMYYLVSGLITFTLLVPFLVYFLFSEEGEYYENKKF